MKLIINAIDKMIIRQLLPQTESVLVQIMARDIGRKIEITQKDRETINLKPVPMSSNVSWDTEKVSATEIETEFTEAEIQMLQDQVKKLDDAKKISSVMLDTVLKIRDAKIGKKK